MIHSIVKIIQTVGAIGALAGAGYYLVCLGSAWSYLQATGVRRREESTLGVSLPPVSILKPLKGVDPNIYESFRSHCDQDYAADYEIIFGVSEADDPAVPIVRRLQQEFQNLDHEQQPSPLCCATLELCIVVRQVIPVIVYRTYHSLPVGDQIVQQI